MALDCYVTSGPMSINGRISGELETVEGIAWGAVGGVSLPREPHIVT